MTCFRRTTSHRGFTLIESLATISVLGIVGMIASSIIFTLVDGYFNASTSAQLHAEISTAMDRTIRELRNIPLDSAADDIAPDISNVTTTSIAWNRNGAASLELNSGNLTLAVSDGPARVLLRDVTSFSVQAFDEDNDALGSNLSGDACDPIRRVRLTITMTRNGVSETLRTKVFLRSTALGSGS